MKTLHTTAFLLLAGILLIITPTAMAQDSLDVTILDTFDLDDAVRVVTTGNTAYVAIDSGVVKFSLNGSGHFDMSSPLNFDAPIVDLALNESYLFAATDGATTIKVHIIDLGTMAIAGTYSTASTTNYFRTPIITASSNYLFFHDGQSREPINILDITTPAEVFEVSEFYSNADDPPMDMEFSNGNVYLVHPDSALVVCYVEDPQDVQIIGEYLFDSTTENVAIKYPYALVGYMTDYDLHIVDISDPSAIEWVSDFEIEGHILDIYIHGNTAYLLVSEDTGVSLQLIDLQDILHPNRIGYYHANSGDFLASTGDHVFVISDGLVTVYTLDTTGGIAEHLGVLQVAYWVYKAYPNPFNPYFSVEVALPHRLMTRVTLYDVLGRRVATMFSGYLQAGHTEIHYDSSNLPSGVYLMKTEVIPEGDGYYVNDGPGSTLQKVVKLK